MSDFINEELMKTSLDGEDGEIKIETGVSPTYANAVNVHKKKVKEIEKALKDKKPELKKAFTGIKGKTTIMPRNDGMKKLHLSESAFDNLREHYDDAPEQYQQIFRVLDNMEHIINYINELSDEEFTFEDMLQSYNVLEDALAEFEGYLDDIKVAQGKKSSVSEATATAEKPAEKQTRKSNKYDLFDLVYAELDGGQKGVEAKYRRVKAGKTDRYQTDEVSTGWEPSLHIAVLSQTEEGLDFARRVADEYGLEFKVHRYTSRYAAAPFEGRIFVPEGAKVSPKGKLSESVDNNLGMTIAKYFDYSIPNNTAEVFVDLVERAVENNADRDDVVEAVAEAIDEGLIYHNDIWAVKAFYEESELSDEAYEQLINDLCSIVESLSVDEGMSKKRKPTPIKESYVKVDTIECGEDTYRVIGGGFNPTADALISVESEHGEKFRFHIGDVIEFYTWYDKNGNVVHEPDSMDEGLTSAERHNRRMDKIFTDKRNRDADMVRFIRANSDASDEKIKKAQDDDKVGLLLKELGLHDAYWSKSTPIKESKRTSRRIKKG